MKGMKLMWVKFTTFSDIFEGESGGYILCAPKNARALAVYLQLHMHIFKGRGGVPGDVKSGGKDLGSNARAKNGLPAIHTAGPNTP